MGKFVDLTGKKFGRLTVIKRLPNDKWGHSRFLCQCECGNTKETTGDNLIRGICQSCGCIQKEVTIARSTIHNLCHTHIYKIWESIKRRCFLKNQKNYKNYGGRGITICDEWLNPENFYKWAIANGYKKGLSIDRIDVNGNYEPSNCRWATSVQQANNTRGNRYITYNGETHTIADWSRILGIKAGILYQRLGKGWSIERAFTTPPKNKC